MTRDIEPPVLPLEEKGLHLLLERIHRGTASANDFARIALIDSELIQGGEVGLSEAGKHKLQVLRAKVAASNDELVFRTADREGAGNQAQKIARQKGSSTHHG